MTKVKDVVQVLELLAPPSYQETYDNSGLIIGDSEMDVTGILVCLDSTEDIINEAIAKNCNLVVAHHPIVFSGIKKLNGKNYVERTVIKAIKNDIAIYAIHTNLDNVHLGVSNKIADILQLTNRKVLLPKKDTLMKLSFYCPNEQVESVLGVLFAAGAGRIGNYDSCSFRTDGTGSFKALEGADPYVGKVGEVHLEKEQKIEVVLPSHLESNIVSALISAHPYEEVAYFIQALENTNSYVGSGIIGLLPFEMKTLDFLNHLKLVMNTECVRYTDVVKDNVRKVALVGGAGSFALSAAIRQGADVFVTGDFKYHEFFDAENHLVIADIGHYESEQFTVSLIVDYLTKKIPNFAVLFTELNTNPVKYL